jgi:hypothetical protein
VAADLDPHRLRAAARALGLVRLALIVRLVATVITMVELGGAEFRPRGVVVVGVVAILISDVVGAAGGVLLAGRSPVGRVGAAVGCAGLLASTMVEGWAAAWRVGIAPGLPAAALSVDTVGFLVGVVGILAASVALMRAIDRGALAARLQRVATLLILGGVLWGLELVFGRSGGVVVVAAVGAIVIVVGIVKYLLVLGHVRTALRDHAPEPPRATAL